MVAFTLVELKTGLEERKLTTSFSAVVYLYLYWYCAIPYCAVLVGANLEVMGGGSNRMQATAGYSDDYNSNPSQTQAATSG